MRDSDLEAVLAASASGNKRDVLDLLNEVTKVRRIAASQAVKRLYLAVC